MTLSERRYYQIAIGVSILLHAVLLLITLPQGLFGPGSQVEMISAGMVELTPEMVPTKPVINRKPDRPAVVASQTTKDTSVKPVAKIAPKRKTVQAQEKKVAEKKAPEKVISDLKKKPQEKLVNKPEEVPEKNVAGATDSGTGKPTEEAGANKSNGKDQAAKPDQSGGKPATPQMLGTGESMIAFGLETDFYYPKNARNEGKEGDVRFRVLVAADGSLEKIEPLQLSGDPRLDNAAFGYIRRNYQFKTCQEKYYIEMVVIFRIANEAPIVKTLHSQTRL
jgi:TonB family protein